MSHQKLSGRSIRAIVCSGAFVSLAALMPVPATAADADTTGGAAPESTAAPSPVTLTGKVVEVSVTLNNLRDARLSISRVRKAAANLYDEVTRQEMTMNYNPNLIGTTVITIPTPSFTGQLLPARKKWVNASMSEMGPIIALFKEDVDLAIESNRQTDVDAAAKASLEPLRTDVFEAVKASSALYERLEKLTAGSSYDNEAIASDVKNLDAQMKTLDKSLKRGISILQKEAKAQKKNKKAD